MYGHGTRFDCRGTLWTSTHKYGRSMEAALQHMHEYMHVLICNCECSSSPAQLVIGARTLATRQTIRYDAIRYVRCIHNSRGPATERAVFTSKYMCE